MIRSTFLLTALLTLPVAAQASRGPVDPPVALCPDTTSPTHPVPTECLTTFDAVCK